MLWKPKARIEASYRKNLLIIAKEIIRRCKGITDIPKLLRELYKIADSVKFKKLAEATAMKFITGLFADQGKTWREAARINSKGKELYQALQEELKGDTGKLLAEEIRQNAALIRTLPNVIAEDVTKKVAEETLKGRRASDIAKDIEKMFPAQTKARAKLIARTEASKVNCNLIEQRSLRLGIPCYRWHDVGGAAGDGRTRYSHRKMHGVIVFWNNPPAPEDLFPMYTKEGKKYKNTLGHYHAGCAPNCRCYPDVIMEMDDVEWPARVYTGGNVVKMTKAQFIQQYGEIEA